MSRLDLPSLPALVVGGVSHQRFRPQRYGFTHRHYQWLVDLDSVPQQPWWLRPLGSLHAQDHLGGDADFAALKDNVLRVLRREGVEEPVSRVIMLAHARIFGHVFDPMSAFWCLNATGDLVAVLVEVHNTYGGRHAYVLRPDSTGSDTVDKAFYVSPFNAVEGTYEIRLRLEPDTVAVAIRLTVDGEPLMSASVTGTPEPAGRAALIRAGLRQPWMTARVTSLIRWHGIRLWRRGLPVRAGERRTKESVR